MPPKKKKTKEDEAQAKELVVESSSRSLVVVVGRSLHQVAEDFYVCGHGVRVVCCQSVAPLLYQGRWFSRRHPVDDGVDEEMAMESGRTGMKMRMRTSRRYLEYVCIATGKSQSASPMM